MIIPENLSSERYFHLPSFHHFFFVQIPYRLYGIIPFFNSVFKMHRVVHTAMMHRVKVCCVPSQCSFVSQKRCFSEGNTARGVLGLDPKKAYTKAEVTAKYRSLAKMWHPDTPGGNVLRMRDINVAYISLKREMNATGSLPETTTTTASSPSSSPSSKSAPREVDPTPDQPTFHSFILSLIERLEAFFGVKYGKNKEKKRVKEAPGKRRRSASSSSSSSSNSQPNRYANAEVASEQHQKRRAAIDKLNYERRMKGSNGAASRVASQGIAERDRLLQEGEVLVKALCVTPPVWLWYNRERAGMGVIQKGVASLQRQQIALGEDKTSVRLCPKRLAWYHKEMREAARAEPKNVARLALLIDVIAGRGDIDLMQFEKYINEGEEEEEEEEGENEKEVKGGK